MTHCIIIYTFIIFGTIKQSIEVIDGKYIHFLWFNAVRMTIFSVSIKTKLLVIKVSIPFIESCCVHEGKSLILFKK